MFDVGVDSQFENDDKMFIPLNIEDVEVDDVGYFTSGRKFLIAALSLVPYTFIFFVIDQIPSILFFVVFTIIYLIGYSFVLRFFVFEEKEQRKSMKSLKQNKVSNLSYFWELDKVGSSPRDTGMLYKQSDGLTVQRSYIIELDGGSTVGLAPDAYRQYRGIWSQFLRECHKMNFDIKIYQERKRPDISESLKHYALELKENKEMNDLLRYLLLLNIETNYLYSSTDDQRYVYYIEVVNRRIDNLFHFKNILEDILDKTFRTHAVFSSAKVLDKIGVDRFLALHYGQSTLNTNGLRMNGGFRDLAEYIDVVMIVGKDGQPIPFDWMQEMGHIESESIFGNYGTLDRVLQDVEFQESNRERIIQESLLSKQKELRELRRQEKISYDEFERRMKEVEEAHLPENINEDLFKSRSQLEREVREAKREVQRNERKEKQRLKQEEIAEKGKKWYRRKENPFSRKKDGSTYEKLDEYEFVDKEVTIDDLFGGDE